MMLCPFCPPHIRVQKHKDFCLRLEELWWLSSKGAGFRRSGVQAAAMAKCYCWTLNPLCPRGAVLWLTTLCSDPNFPTSWGIGRKEFPCSVTYM